MSPNLDYLHKAVEKISFEKRDGKLHELIGWLSAELSLDEKGRQIWKQAVDGIYGDRGKHERHNRSNS